MSHPDVAHVVLVLPPEDAAHPPAFLSDFSGLSVVAGGASSWRLGPRPASRRLRRECTVVLVHDGARPFVDRERHRGGHRLRAGGRGRGARGAAQRHPQGSDRRRPDADPADPSTGAALAGPDPQGFPGRCWKRLMPAPPRDGHRATDDAALVEAMGVPVRLVPDSCRNLKVTTPEDLVLAELLAGTSP